MSEGQEEASEGQQDVSEGLKDACEENQRVSGGRGEGSDGLEVSEGL